MDCGPSRFKLGRTASKRPLVNIFDVLGQLFDDIGLIRRSEIEIREPLSNLFFPVRHVRFQ